MQTTSYAVDSEGFAEFLTDLQIEIYYSADNTKRKVLSVQRKRV